MGINWELRWSAIELWQPWCYACYLPAFFSELSHIEETHPEAYIWLSEVWWILGQDRGPKPFLVGFQLISHEEDGGTRDRRGTEVFSIKIRAIGKYYPWYYFNSCWRSKYFFKQPRDLLVDLNRSNSEHTDLHKTRLAKRDAADVKSLIALLKSNWIKPFSTEQ